MLKVREADGFPDMRISKSGKQVFPEKSGFCGKSSTPAHVRFFPKPLISFASAHCASVGTARALGGYNQKSPTENLAAANAHEVITPRAVVTGFKIYMRCARRTVPPGRKRAP